MRKTTNRIKINPILLILCGLTFNKIVMGIEILSRVSPKYKVVTKKIKC